MLPDSTAFRCGTRVSLRLRLALLAGVFVTLHLLLLPPAPGDIDEVNFAFGVRDFDVARHQPHPPGYPVFVALAKLSTAAFESFGIAGAETRGIAVWGALAGALLVPALFALFRATGATPRESWWATVLTVSCPVLWFTASRPLSDVPGLALAVTAQALLLRHGDRTRWCIAGAFLAGLTIGVRSQTFLLTLPLLAMVLLRRPMSARFQATAASAFALGVLTWAVPLVWTSGGISAYLATLRNQGVEDFSGVTMLWNVPTLRTARSAVWHAFVTPWASPVLAVPVLASAVAGVVALRTRKTLFVVAVLWVPYLCFHLLFHEPVTVRYAIPLAPLAAILAVVGVSALQPRAVGMSVGAVAAAGLTLTLPAAVLFATQSAPAVRALQDLAAAAATQRITVASHRRVASESRRLRQFAQWPTDRWLPSPRASEWLELTRRWRTGKASAAWFFARRRRTDVALIDSHERIVKEYRWGFEGRVFMGGARPAEFNAYVYPRPPGWFLEQGWALTPEVAAVTTRRGRGPHVRPSAGWIRRRGADAQMVLGGRHLGAADAPAVRLAATLGGRPVVNREVLPGFFLEIVTLPAGSLAGDGGYAPLLVSAQTPEGGAQPVSLEQFNVQSSGIPMFAYGDGWHEPEFRRETGRLWRWMSEQAVLWVRPIGRAVTLTIRGASPLRYFSKPIHLRLTVGGRPLSQLTVAHDFTWQVTLPDDLLGAHDGRVTIESDQYFVPSRRGRSGDRRHLALRVHSISAD